MKTFKLLSQLALAVGLSATMTVVADPIASFNYTQEFEFTEFAPGSVDAEVVTDVDPAVGGSTDSAADNSSQVDGNTYLEWGTALGNGRSSLSINGAASGDATSPLTSGAVAVTQDINAMVFSDGPSVTHNNFVISGAALQTATLQDVVVLDPNDGSGATEQNITFDIDFVETNNNMTNDPLTNGLPCASGNINEFGCGDIFVLAGGLLGAPTIVNGGEIAFLIDSFVRDDYLYEVFLREATGALGVLSDDACSAALGAGSTGCVGFTTAENESTTFQLEFAILASEAVPEPATLALFAGSLLLMGLVRRRKIK